MAAGTKKRPAEKTAPQPKPSGAALCLCAAAISAALLAVYWQVRGFGFVYDDVEYIERNAALHGGLTLNSAAWALTTFHSANWHPITWISHALDLGFYGLDAGGHHLTNLALHLANSLLLLWVLFRLTGSVWRSTLAAALFGVHPLHVEAVAWISERKELLAAFFWLLTMLAYLRYTERPGRRRYAAVMLMFALGLMSKPMVVSLPLALLILDYWPLGRVRAEEGGSAHAVRRRLLLEKAPLFVLAGISSIVTIAAQQSAGAVVTAEAFPFGERLGNALISYGAYLLKTIWPSGLSPYYPYPAAIDWGAAALSLALLVSISWMCVRFKERRFLLSGWLWYLITLVPVIGLVQVGGQAMADRYTYIPLIGVLIMAAWSLPEWKQGRAALCGLCVSALTVLAFLAERQAAFWQSDISLWARALAVTLDNEPAERGLASALEKAGRYEEAALHCERALKLNPSNGGVHKLYGVVQWKLGRLEPAYLHFSEALRLAPRDAEAATNLGSVLGARGDFEGAAGQFRAALEIDPNCGPAHANLGALLHRQGRIDEAVVEYRRALAINPQDAGTLDNLRKARPE
jgi:protein O-mannosyl-transferase